MTRRYLDTCALINLYASRHLEAMATRQGSPFLVVPAVALEAGWVYQRAGFERDTKVEIPIAALVDKGIIEVVSLTPTVMMHFMRLVRELDDGEAMTIAAAQAASGGVITDDDAALTYLRTLPTLATSTGLTVMLQEILQAAKRVFGEAMSLSQG